MGQSTGKKVYYLESPVTGWAQMPYNTKEVLTESGSWESPITGFVKVTCIGGGQAGGSTKCTSTGLSAFYRGLPGAATSFGGVLSRGALGLGSEYTSGGAAGEVVVGYVFVEQGDIIDYSIGAGGVASAVSWTGDDGSYYGGYPGTLTVLTTVSTSPVAYAGVGGTGGSNGTPYGGGGGAASHISSSGNSSLASLAAGSSGGKSGGFQKVSTATAVTILGGDGAAGVIILEYADPKKKS